MVLDHSVRVLMVISQFYPLLGGTEVQAQLLARDLMKRGIKVSILTRRLKGLPRYELIDGIPVYREIKTIDLGFLWGCYYALSVGMFLYRRRNQYDIIHCHILQGFHTVIALIFKYLFNKKVVVKMSSSGETSDLKLLKEVKLGSLFLQWVKNVDAVISVCKQSSRELVENGFSRDILVEIPNGVNTHKYSKGIPRGKKELKTITCIGRLDRHKGVDYLLRGFKTLLTETDTVRLVIVGTGPDETHLKYLTEELELQGHVIFRGRQEDIPGILDSTDLFVLPSLSEGMSNVLLEAMSCGLPVVATSVGGNGDLIRDGYNGILIPPKDSKRLSAVLLRLLEDEEFSHSLGKAAEKTVTENYAIDKIGEQYMSLYNRLVAYPYVNEANG